MINPAVQINSDTNKEQSFILPERQLLSAKRPNVSQMDKVGFHDYEEYQTATEMFGPYSTNFEIAIKLATKRIWIFDQYFMDYDPNKDLYSVEPCDFYEYLFCTCSTEILVICSGTEGAKDQREKLRKKFAEYRSNGLLFVGFNFEARFIESYHPPCHDRFAIVDNELWHFGANVAGTHNGVNCFSRGWSASEHGAIRLFQEYWEAVRT
jgi:hypothetical protein